MKIFFTCSRTGSKIEEFQNYDFTVLKELKNQKLKIESTLEKTYLNKTPKLKAVPDLAINEIEYKHIHDSAVRQSIRNCDAIIVEVSYPSFRLGFETFFALSINKPVLVLSRFKNLGNLIAQPHFFGAKYSDFSLPDDIEKFVNYVKKHKLGIRFNLFISNDHKAKMDKISKKYNVSLSDYLRNLIDQDSSL